jgi:hypothetical protein
MEESHKFLYYFKGLVYHKVQEPLKYIIMSHGGRHGQGMQYTLERWEMHTEFYAKARKEENMLDT